MALSHSEMSSNVSHCSSKLYSLSGKAFLSLSLMPWVFLIRFTIDVSRSVQFFINFPFQNGNRQLMHSSTTGSKLVAYWLCTELFTGSPAEGGSGCEPPIYCKGHVLKELTQKVGLILQRHPNLSTIILAHPSMCCLLTATDISSWMHPLRIYDRKLSLLDILC